MEPVVAQPATVYGVSVQQQGMQPPPSGPIQGCPPGLEYLAQVDQVLVHQEVEALEAITGIETANRFRILNSAGQQIYFAGEDSSFFERICCTVLRGFVFNVTDNNGQVVMRVRRKFECCKGCSCCMCCTSCNYFASIEDKNGQVLGHISTLPWCCSPIFAIYDENQTVIAEIRLGCCPIQNMCCTADLDFPVVDVSNESQLATIKKTWQGVMKSLFTKADNFSVVFPTNLDVKKKALLIGSVFVVDMMVFEQQNKAS
ncbi:phospholipid scramblase 2-like [Babylonia areolata]|uniref:phospholipid scramblase 2-like n=1 Tax=Babylonia areolata TaxID=304850 RepID=UPI003FD5BE97